MRAKIFLFLKLTLDIDGFKLIFFKFSSHSFEPGR
jgi:hypothetical protein